MIDLPVDVTTLTPEVRQALQTACANESSRQATLSAMPTQAVTCAYNYKNAGGDPNDVLQAVQNWIAQQVPA